MTTRECFEDLLGRFHVVRVVYHQHGGLRVPDCASPIGGNPQLDFGLDIDGRLMLDSSTLFWSGRVVLPDGRVLVFLLGRLAWVQAP